MNLHGRSRVLFLQNCPAEGFGRYVTRLRELGIGHDIVRAFQGDDPPLPDAYSAIIVGGTPVSVSAIQRHDFLIREERYLKKAVDLGKAVLGICFGAQLLARMLGAGVRKNPVMEIGASPVHLTAAGRSDPLFQGFPKALPVFHWHGETFDIPPWGLRLATGQACLNQAFRMGSAVGLQFHLEVTAEDARGWADAYPGELSQVAKSKTRLIRECREHEPQMTELADRLLGNFLAAAAY